MIVYFDTSALVKLLIQEPGTDVVRQLWTQAPHRVSCSLVTVEARAAIAAARRAKRLTAPQSERARQGLVDLIGRLTIVPVSDELIENASALAEQEALRGYDAVHLAAALLVNATVFATADRELEQAAARRGMHTLGSGAAG